MGQALSGSFDDDDVVDSADEPEHGDVRRHFMDAKRVATLSWPEFVECINGLNEKCRTVIDDNGKHLIFAVRKGSTDSYLWKATVQICCVKYNTLTKKPESYKTMNLSKFLRVYSSLIPILNSLRDDPHSSPGASVQDSSASSSSVEDTGVWKNRQRDLNASLFLERVDNLASVVRDKQDSTATECVVCMERKPDVVLPCSHAYCLPCIEQWNVNNHDCPTCRADLHSTDDAWVISDYPDKQEFMDYLLKLSE